MRNVKILICTLLMIIMAICSGASAEAVCEHVYEEVILNPATCMDKGIYMQHCTLCGNRTYGAIEPAHTYHEEPDVVVLPVCDEEGGKVWYCTVCNVQQDPEHEGVKCDPLPATHTYGEEIYYVEATCEKDGQFIRTCSVCSVEEIVQINEEAKATGHKWRYEHLAPTCEEAEKHQVSCEYCGKVRWERFVTDHSGAQATGHVKPENVTILQQADCENAQTQAWDCINCGMHIEEKVGDALGHTIEVVVKEEATCSKMGLADHVCSVCAAVVEENVILPIAPACTPYETIISPSTCTENGVMEYRCQWCDQHLYFAVIPYGHEAGDVAIMNPASCTENGLGHVHCMICDELLNEVSLPATGHVFSGQPTLQTDACGEETTAIIQCSNCGYEECVDTIKRDVQHQRAYRYTAPNCEHNGLLEVYCSICDDALLTMDIEDDAALGHVYAQEQTVIDAPDCTSVGSAAWICLRCSAVSEETVLPALGHTPELKVLSEATCYAAGLGHQVCAVCDTVLEENVVLAQADACESKMEVLIAPSCTADGLCQYVCRWCDKLLRYAIIPANHETGEHIRTKEPTCTEEGAEYVSCRLCGEVLTEVTLGALEHDYDYEHGVMVLEATCTEGALMHYFCKTCNADGQNMQDGVLARHSGEALGHTWQEEAVYAEADCVHAGRTVKMCALCGAQEVISYDRNAPALGHTVLYKLIMPTCTEPMMVSGICTVCGYEVEREKAQQIEGISTGALGHSEPEEWQIEVAPDCQNTGLRSKYCEVCGELIVSEQIPTVSCQEQLECILQAADCRTQANTVSLMTCIWCDDIIRVQVDAYQHVYDDQATVVVLEATCEEEGIALRTCSLCGHEEQLAIAASGHLVTKLYVLPADCENPERVVISCMVCNEILSLEAQIGEPLGHAFKVFDPSLGEVVCIYCHAVELQ